MIINQVMPSYLTLYSQVFAHLPWYFMTPLLYCLVLGGIILCKKYFISQKGRDFLHMGEHQGKHETSSMGGLAFYVLLPLVYYKIYNGSAGGVFVVMAASFSGLVGGIDDWFKLRRGAGLSIKIKFLFQMIAAFVPALYYYYSFPEFLYIKIGSYHLYVGIFMIAWIMWIIMSTTHAVNLTDGIDGLAISQFLIIELIFFTLVGLDLAFLFFLFYQFFIMNRYKAEIFMGDIGAFFLGGLLAGFFIHQKIELLLPFAGIVFVGNTISVIIQTWFYKKHKKRFFSFAPYHHALEKKGWSENKICIAFSLVTLLGNAVALGLYVLFY
jgi:phospho-N-acetylmuramoyl-pentapeptide-transferase